MSVEPPPVPAPEAAARPASVAAPDLPAAPPVHHPWQSWAAWAVIAIAAVPRIWAAVADQSMFWPDEVCQTLEQAHRVAFGTGIIPWEFRDAARSWVFPGALGIYWKAVALLGVKSSFGIVTAAKLLMVAMALFTLEIGRRMAARLGGPTAGLVAVLLVGACPPLIFFGSRAMTEVASIPLIVAASYFAVVAEHRRPALAGALAALSIYLRYQNGLVAAGLLLILLARREWPLVRRYLIGAVPVGLAGGLLDWATWKYPFQSFIVYVKFNLIEGKASDFGRSPFGFYAEMLAGSIGVSFGAVLLGLAASARRALGLVVLVAVYFLAHSVIPHKELRFMLPMLPLALILAAVGLTELARALWPDGRFAVVAAALFALIMGWDAAHPLARDYGRGDGNWILWHAGQDYFEVDWAAEKQPDLCGIAMVGNHPAWTGGYTYLHRNVPIYFDLGHLGSTNYVVGGKAERMTREWTKVFESGNYALYHRAGGCAPDPNYKPWL